MTSIEPAEGVVLVELIKEFGDIPTPEKSHDSLTSGKIVSVNKADEDYNSRIGQIAHWRKYVDDARLPGNLCFIDIKDIKGFSYAPDSSNING